MQSLGDILPVFMNNIGLRQRFKAELIVLHWRQIVGGEIAANTRPGKIHRGVMAIAAKNAVWAHHLSTMKEEIIAKINAFAGENAVADLKFQAGYFQDDQNNEKNDGDDKTGVFPVRDIIIGEREAVSIEMEASAVGDEELRRRFKRLMSKQAAAEKAKKKYAWLPCPECGVMRHPGQELCTVCAAAARVEGIIKVRRILREAPWLGYKECVSYVPCRPMDFAVAKEMIADELIGRLGMNEDDKMGLMTLVMLLHGVEPQDVSQGMIEKTLAKVRRKKYVSAPRS